MAEPICRGDVVLVDGLGQGWVSASIALGATLRLGRANPYARWTHIALVYDVHHQNAESISIVEARAGSGVHKAFLSKYERHYAVVHTHVAPHDWEQVEKFLDEVLRARERYDFVAYAGLFLYAVTGTRLCIQRAGTATCSGLVADALTRAGVVWSRPPYAMTPAGIASDLAKLGCPITMMVTGPAKTTAWGRAGEFVGGALARVLAPR